MEVTTVLLSEQMEQHLFRFEHYLSSGIINLHHFGDGKQNEMTRGIQLLKIRGTKHDSLLHPIAFTESGLNVGGRRSMKTDIMDKGE